MEGVGESGGFLKHNLRWSKLTHEGLALAGPVGDQAHSPSQSLTTEEWLTRQGL